MTKIEFYDDNGNTVRVAEIPSSWDELTDEQIAYIFKKYERYIAGTISALQMNVEILCMLFGMKAKFNRSQLANDEFCANIYRLCEANLAFLFKSEGEDKPLSIAFNTVHNPLLAVRSGRARTLLIGPADLLQDLTFGEFRHASFALNAFFKSQDMSDLDECIAHLYRRKSKTANRAGRYVSGVKQETFSDDVRNASNLESWQKTLIMLWFASCLNYLQTGHLVLNGEDIDLKLLFSGGSSDSGPALTWNDLLIQIARDNSVGNIERTDEEPLFSILGIMWSNYKENKRYEKASKAKKS